MKEKFIKKKCEGEDEDEQEKRRKMFVNEKYRQL